MATSEFRQHLPDLSLARFTTMKTQDAHEYAKAFKENKQPPWLFGLYQFWLTLAKEPFRGVTIDGNVRPNLYHIEDESLPIQSIVDSVGALLNILSDEQKAAVCYHIDSPEWRTWSNPEFLLSNKGIRLDEVSAEVRAATLCILQKTLSPEGYDKAIKTMKINGFLGDFVLSPKVMNENSYNFVLFGSPSTTTPWGFSFYGHHLCLNLFLYRGQILIGPWFTGAEPNCIDTGPEKGARILYQEEAIGLELMQSLSTELQGRARIYEKMRDTKMPHGRWNHDDQRHMCGAYRDNRVVPYEGIKVSEMNDQQVQLVLQILEQYLLYLPAKSRHIQLSRIQTFFDETYFCWIGGFGDEDPFYYRIQSPVILIEFDHHSGVFLNNKEPAKFHIHTLLRLPNGGDYGHALRTVIPGKEQNWIWEGEHN